MTSQIMNDLRAGKIIEFEGLFFRKKDGDLRPGDIYFAQRNTGPKFLIVKEVRIDFFGEYVTPTTNEYAYNLNECIKAEWIESPE